MLVKKTETLIDWTSISAVSSSATDAAIKLLTALVMSYEYEYDADMKRKLNGWYTDSKKFFSRFGIKDVEVRTAVRGVVGGKDPDADTTTHDAIVETIHQMKDARKDMASELDLSKAQLDMLNDIRMYMLTESAAAFRRISKNISAYRDLDLNEMFVPDTNDTASEQKELNALVKKHTGKEGLSLPVSILKDWQDYNKKHGKKKADHVKYLKLKRDLNLEFKAFLTTLVRSSGKHTMLVQDVIHACKQNNVPNSLPEGFVGRIDDHGKFYTTEDNKLKTSPTGEVRMNPNYNPKEDNAYVCEFLPFGGAGYLRAYTENYTKQAKQKNFKLVSDTAPRIKSLSGKWLSDMAKVPRTRESVLAAIVEFMYETGARVGGKGSESKGEQTYGTTLIEMQHVLKLDESMVHIRYHGKSKGLQNHTLKFNTVRLKKLGKAINALAKGKKKNDVLFSFQGKPFTSAAVKRYMTGLGFPAGWSAKKLRTAKGTVMMDDAVRRSPFKKGGDWSDRDVHRWLEEQALKVGEQLGHSSGEKVTPNTAIQNYIDPMIVVDFYNKLGIRPSAKFQKAIDSVA